MKCMIKFSSLVIWVGSSPTGWLWALRWAVRGSDAHFYFAIKWVLFIASDNPCVVQCKAKTKRENPLSSGLTIAANWVERRFWIFLS